MSNDTTTLKKQTIRALSREIAELNRSARVLCAERHTPGTREAVAWSSQVADLNKQLEALKREKYKLQREVYEYEMAEGSL